MSRASRVVRTLLKTLLATCAAGCIEVDGRDPPELPELSDLVRTVDVELLRTAQRRMVLDGEGIASYEPAQPLGGVEVCVVAQRTAFASDDPFEELDPPRCVNTKEGESTRLSALPADSDLLLSYTKDGFRSVLITFRSDDHDVAVPSWADNATYFVPMLPEDDALPIDGEAEPGADDGMVALWVEAVGEYGVGEGVAQLNAEEDHGVAPAEGVDVTISETGGAERETVVTRRDRPQFLALPSGRYLARFTHAELEIVPLGVQEQFMITGLPTDRFDTIEVPVRAGHLTLAMVDGFCPLPADPNPVFEDLATCTFTR